MKRILNVLLLISFTLTIMVPLTGVTIHKMVSTLFLLLSLIHTIIYRKKIGFKRYVLVTLIFVSYISGLLSMVFDNYSFILIIHKVISILIVFFLAIHIFIFQKCLLKKKNFLKRELDGTN